MNHECGGLGTPATRLDSLHKVTEWDGEIEVEPEAMSLKPKMMWNHINLIVS